MLIVWAVAACTGFSGDTGDDQSTTTAGPTTTSPVTITATTVATTSTRRATTTITTPIAAIKSDYINQLLIVEEDVRNLAARLQEVNQGWDNREMGLSVTDAALVKATETAEGLWVAFEQIVPPADLARSDVHDAIRSEIDRIRIHTNGILAGLRSADTGEARTEALAVVLEAVGTLETEINRAATLFGYQNPERNVPRPRATTTTTTTTTRPATTTTRQITTTTKRPGADRFGRLTFCDYYGNPCPASFIGAAREYCIWVADYGRDEALELLLIATEMAVDADAWDAVAIAAAADLANCQNLR